MPLAHERPDAPLAAELLEVATDAEKFLTYLRADNSIPDDFPKAQLEEVGSSLSRLPNVTAAAAFEILKYACRRLPAIRREYLVPELPINESKATSDSDRPPPQTRGMTLDRHLKDLIASVGTALDECRKQEGEGYEGEPELDIRVTHAGQNQEAINVARAARKVAHNSDRTSAELSELTLPHSERADILKRTLHDVSELGHVAAAELSFNTTITNWLRPIGAALGRYPTIVEWLGKAMQRGADISEVTYIKWEEFKHKALRFLAEEIRAAGRDIEELGRKWESERQQRQPNISSYALGSANEREEKQMEEVERRVLIEKIRLSDFSREQRLDAIEQLVSRFPTHRDTALLLAERAKNDRSQVVREASVRKLLTLGDNEGVAQLIDTLIAAYDQRPNSDSSSMIVQTLSTDRLAHTDRKKILQFLTDVVLDSRHSGQTITAIRSLLKNFGRTDGIAATALDIVQGYPDPLVRGETLAAMVLQIPAAEETRDAVTYCVKQASYPALRNQAVRAIAEHLNEWPWALSLVDQALRGSRNRKIRKLIASARRAGKPAS